MTVHTRAGRPATRGWRIPGRTLLAALGVWVAALGPAWAGETVTLTLSQFKPRDPAAEAQLLARFTDRTGIRVRERHLPASSDVQHQQYVTWLAARDRSVDVYLIDNIWTAEFAAAGWIVPLDDRVPPAEREAFLSAPLESATWRGRLYALPRFTESGLLYYRRDLVPAAPTTWPGLRDAAAPLVTPARAGYVFQGKQYEGLVVNFLEVLWAMGGDLVDPSGRVAVNSPEAVRALQFMVDLVQHSPVVPRGVLTYTERESLQEFLEGRAVFHRNWSYAWSLIERAGSKVRGRVGIAPLPGPAALGGWHLAISAHSRQADAAWRLVEFLASPEAQKVKAIEEGRLPTRTALYDDPDVLRANPHFAHLREPLNRTRPRPASPFYPRLSGILQSHLSRALVGLAAPQEALDEAARQMAPLLGR
jgi:multiple sugar transport system substrate-binding protein